MTKKKENPEKGGKPKGDITDKLRIFEKALIDGYRIGKALELADIARSTYYDYLDANPKYSDKIEKLSATLEEIADDALATQLKQKPEDKEHRKEIASIAFKIREEKNKRIESEEARKAQREEKIQQLPNGAGITVNIGNQITAEEANDLTDEELALVSSRQKTLAQVLADRKNSPKKDAK